MSVNPSEYSNVTAGQRNEISLEVISPLFMHGADTKRPEYRIPSIRGVMNYWWRALQIDIKPQQLIQKGMDIFGGTFGGEGGTRSSFSLQVLSTKAKTDGYFLLPHKSKNNQKAIVGGTVFDLVLASTSHKICLEYIYDVLQLAVFLGGFGQRARRGYGSLQIVNTNWKDVNEYLDQVHRLLKKVGPSAQWQVDADTGLTMTNKVSSTEHPTLRAIYIGQKKDSVADALYAIGVASHLYNGGTLRHLGDVSDKERPHSKRQASPLHCTVRKIGNLFYPVIAEVRTDEEKRFGREYTEARDNFIQYLQK